MPPLAQAGTFKARPIQSGVKRTKNGAFDFTVEYAITHAWQGGGWVDCAEHNLTCWGNHTIIQIDNSINQNQFEGVVDAFGWPGSIEKLAEEDHTGKEVKITCKENSYDGKTTFRAEWVASPDSRGGVMGAASADELKALDSRLGSKLRALGASLKKPEPGHKLPFSTRPPSPPPPPAPAQSADDLDMTTRRDDELKSLDDEAFGGQYAAPEPLFL